MTTIRPADPGDMAAVADLWHEGWHDAHAGHVPAGLTAVRSGAAFRDRTPLRVSDTTVAVSEDGALLGFVMVVDDEVEQVFVARAARGTGVAATLLAEAERHGDLQRDTTTCGSLLAAEAEEWRDTVDGEGEVQDWVQREVRRRRCAGEQRSGGGVGGRGRRAEDCEDVCHVPLRRGLLAILHDEVRDLVDDRIVAVLVLVVVVGSDGAHRQRELVTESRHCCVCSEDCALLGGGNH